MRTENSTPSRRTTGLLCAIVCAKSCAQPPRRTRHTSTSFAISFANERDPMKTVRLFVPLSGDVRARERREGYSIGPRVNLVGCRKLLHISGSTSRRAHAHPQFQIEPPSSPEKLKGRGSQANGVFGSRRPKYARLKRILSRGAALELVG